MYELVNQWNAMSPEDKRVYDLEAFHMMNAKVPEDLLYLETIYAKTEKLPAQAKKCPPRFDLKERFSCLPKQLRNFYEEKFRILKSKTERLIANSIGFVYQFDRDKKGV
jgi:hypothetical protein